MPLDQRVLADFRRRLREAVENDREAWAASRRLVASDATAETLQRLHAAVAGSSLDRGIREELLRVLALAGRDGLQAISQEGLRELTGLNPTKAVRNLCLLLGVGAGAVDAGAVSSLAQEKVEAAVRGKDNPFDVLLETDVASLVDCGAGDLTFEETVVEQYLSPLERAGRVFILHAFDRLDPQEPFGAFVQADTTATGTCSTWRVGGGIVPGIPSLCATARRRPPLPTNRPGSGTTRSVLISAKPRASSGA